MQKKKTKLAKRITALVMCTVLLATSMPFMIANAAGTYNPIPAWPAAAADRGVSAYTTDDGSIKVSFPAATADTTYRAKTVTGYLLELVDLGTYDALHTETVLLDKFVTPTGAAPYEEEITAAEIAAKLIGGLDENHRYNVTITAVDSDGWFSDELNTIVSNVPKFTYDPEMYSPITDYSHAMREMMTFESDSNGTALGVVSGGCIQLGGAENQTGVEDPTSATNKDSQGMRVRITGVPSGVEQTFDTAYSRQTWDFTGAKEVWFWLDMTQAAVTGLSFRLRTNEKVWVDWNEFYQSSPYLTSANKMGDIVYSTKGYTGGDAYIYVQRADGGWQKQMMKADGTVDLGYFKGYVRVPLEFFCSETDSVVGVSNQELGVGTKRMSGNSVNTSDIESWLSSLLFSDVTVDPAGTNINDALLIQHRAYNSKSGALGWGTVHTWVFNNTGLMQHETTGFDSISDELKNQTAAMIAAGLGESEARTTVTTGEESTDRAYVKDGTVMNREAGVKAISDLYSAGIAFTDCSAESVDKCVFVDNILFYKDNDDPYPENTLNGSVNTGNAVANYFDQTKEIPRAIFTACETYFNDPNWSDYRAVAYIENLIAGYKRAYGEAGVDTSFLEESALTATADTLLMRDSWDLFLDARQKCQDADTYTKDNNEPDDLVPALERELEKLPDPTSLYSMSDELKAVVDRLHRIYGKLNLGQLDNLGEKAEQKMIDYFTYMETTLQENSMPVGQVLTDNPFIPFADFEQETVGTRAWQLENDSQNYNQVGKDYRYLKSFVSYTTQKFRDFTGYSSDTTSSSLTSDDATMNGFKGNLMQNGAWAYITENGFQGSNGATMTVDSQAYSGGQGYYNIISSSYMGANSATFDEQRANNMGQSTIKLGSLAKSLSGEVSPPLSLVFYADFSQLTDIRVAFSISTYYGGQPDDFAMDMSNDSASRLFYLLDPNSGEWVAANNADCQYALVSSGGADTDGDGVADLTLKNYKGFVMIPLYHFKKGGEAWNRGLKLDETAEALDTIWRISIGVAPGSNEGAADIDGKTFTIDNIGFSYDPVYYADVAASRGITDKPFDEIFKAKALPAEKFEQAVTAIDPYEDTSLATATANARALYNTLSDYQKTRSSVIKAEARLQTYELWVTDPSTRPTAAMTAAELDAAVAALPEAAKAAKNVEDDKDLYYPGLVDDGAGGYAVNYAAYGLSAAQVDEIIALYTDTYKRLTTTDKATLTLKSEFINAYNAAMRCKSLENMVADLQTYTTGLQALYTNIREDKVAGDGSNLNFIKSDETNRALLQSLEDNYNTLDYFAKRLLVESQFKPQFSNAPNAVKRVLKNADTYTLTDGTTLLGGIKTTLARYNTLLNDTKAVLDSRTLFTAAQIQDLDSTITEYKNMLAAYYNVDELNAKIAEILDLFNVYDIGVSDTWIALNKDTLSGSSTYAVSYFEQYPIPAADEAWYVAFTSENGTMKNGVHTLDYQVEITVGGTVKTYSSAELLAGIPAADAKALCTVENNTYTASDPLSAVIRPHFNAVPADTFTGQYSDTLYATLVDKDGNPVLDKSGNVLRKAITVTYAAEDSYAVTYPAEVQIAWQDTSEHTAGYTVKSSLAAGASLSVSAAANDSGQMTNVNTADTLQMIVSNGGATAFSGENTAATPAIQPSVHVETFDNKAVGRYTGTVKYTVTYTPAP
ncbi:MAG: hypothetical protein Q4E21_05335 [Clostridia bacterium]|nr:hypothetical protein [Clostridia bacterium]